MIEEFENKIKDLTQLISQRDQKILYLEGQLEILKRMIFSSKKERFSQDPVGITPLFQDIQTLSKHPSDVKETEVKGHTRRGKRTALPKDIPVVREEFDLSENEKFCSEHKISLERVGEESVQKIDIVPASVQIIEQVTFTYKCPCCENHFVKSKRDPDPIPKSLATPGLLAHIATSKYVDALPLHRQEKIFSRYGLPIDRSTMARWMVACGALVTPLLNLMIEDLQESEVIHIDETPMQVLNEAHRKAEQMSYIWCMARMQESPIVLYRYYDNRGKKTAVELLEGCHGVVVADGYGVYEKVSNEMKFTLAGCMAHCRRKFFEAHKILKKEGPPSQEKKSLSEIALFYIKRLYEIERRIKSESPEKILELREKESLPLMNSFHTWLLETSLLVLPKSHIGKAISYALNQWDKLMVFTKNGKVPLDNNALESKIRPFVIGRNNWLFASSPEGAHANAALYSLVESAKANGVDPYEYLRLIFKELPKSKSVEDYEKLLPYKVREHFHLKAYAVSS